MGLNVKCVYTASKRITRLESGLFADQDRHPRPLAVRWLPRKFVGLLLSGLLALPSAWATDDETLSARDYYEDFPVVLTASRLKQSITRAPAAVSVIDRAMIRASGARRIEEVLRLVPGFYLAHPRGNLPVVAYHGLSDAFSRRMQVLVDGVSIYSPMWGGVDWTELPLSLQDIERIEVVRGANSASYGANAFLGVINIITRDPATETGDEIGMRWGKDGVRDLYGRLVQHGDDWHQRLTLARRQDDGVSFLPDDSRIDLANWRAHKRLGNSDELGLSLNSSWGQQGEGFYNRGIDDTAAARPRDIRQHTMQLRWTRASHSDEETWLQFYHHERSMREHLDFKILVPGMSPIPYRFDFDLDVVRDDLEFQQQLRLNPLTRFVWGIQWRRDGVRSQTFFNRSTRIDSHLGRVFGNLEWSWTPELTMHAAAMLERNSLSGTHLAPRVAFTYALAPGHTLRASLTRAHRAPTLYESHTDQRYWAPPVLAGLAQGRPLTVTVSSLEPLENEVITARDAGYVFELLPSRLSGELRYFNERLGNFIYSDRVRPVNAVFNDKAIDYFNQPGQVHARGHEASLHWRPWTGALLQATMAYTRITSALPDTTQSAPRHTRSLLFEQQLPAGLSFSAAYYRVGSLRWQNSPNGVPDYETLDLRLAHRLRLGAAQLETALVVRNALGDHLDYNVTNRAPQAAYLQLNLGY